MKKRKITYSEPEDYFPKEIREEYGLGEYAKPEKDETASVLGNPEQKPLPTRNKRQMTFLTLRKYLSRIDRISMCIRETLEYENFLCPADIPKSYDKMHVVGIGLAEVEFPSPDGDFCILPCIEVMLSRTKD